MKTTKRNVSRILFLCLSCMLILSSVFIQQKESYAEAPSGTPLLPADALSQMDLIGPSYATMQLVPVSGQPFTEAVRARTTADPQGSHLAQLRIKLEPAIEKNDVLLASFYVRAVELPSGSNVARTEFVMENSVSYEKSTVTGVYVGTDWKKVEIPFVSYMDHPPAGSQFLLRIGFPPQTVEIGGLQLTNYKKTLQVGDLPKTGIGYEGYEGREADAQWRKDAIQRIEQIRKADISVQVKDRSGRKVKDATVEINMLNHDFMWGTAVSASRLFGTNADSEKYRQAVVELFNSAVPENDLKMPAWDSANRPNGAKTVNWLNERGLRVRGHTLVWQQEKYMPATANELKNFPVLYRNRIRDYVDEEAGFFKGQLVDWDVVNEPTKNHILTDSFGMSESKHWYKQVRKIEGKSGADLFLNEATAEGGNPANIANFLQVLEEMKQEGVSIDGIGLQAHFGQYPGSMTRYLSMFDKYATYADKLEITEFDQATPDENLQADFMRDYMTAAFSHPAMKGFLMWGFWDSAHWRKNAPIYRNDWSLKPSGQVWKDLVYGEWWTNETGMTDAKGKFSTRGFLGEYEIKVTYQGKSKTVKATLGQSGLNEIIQMDSEPSGVSTLQKLTVGGDQVKGFKPNQHHYVVEIPRLPYGERMVPGVKAQATDKQAAVKIAHAAAVPGVTTVEVTAQNGDQTTYTVQTIFEPLKPVAGSKLGIGAVTANVNESTAGNVIDQDMSTTWTGAAKNQWIMLDLGELRNVEGLTIAWDQGNERQHAFDIEVSVSGNHWRKVNGASTSSGTTLAPEPYAFRESAARYVRVKNTADQPIGIAEIEVYGKPLSTDATLKNIEVNGVELQAFHPEQLEYTVSVSDGASVPLVKADAAAPKERVLITVKPAAGVPGTTEIQVIAENGATRTYKVHVVIQN